jgi:hypothetical protein
MALDVAKNDIIKTAPRKPAHASWPSAAADTGLPGERTGGLPSTRGRHRSRLLRGIRRSFGRDVGHIGALGRWDVADDFTVRGGPPDGARPGRVLTSAAAMPVLPVMVDLDCQTRDTGEVRIPGMVISRSRRW